MKTQPANRVRSKSKFLSLHASLRAFILATILLISLSASANDSPVVAIVGGGGKAAFEVPANGAVAHFSVGASVNTDGTASGYFETFISGAFAVVVMVTNGSLNADGTVTIWGDSALVLPGIGTIPIPFIITVGAGGPGVGSIDIYHPTITQPWGNHDLEGVTTGNITVKTP